MRQGFKRLLLIALVVACFVTFDSIMDYLGRHSCPFLFTHLIYPVDFAGAIEYAVGFSVLYLSDRRGVEWLTTGTIACIAYSLVIIAQKLIFR